MQRFDEWLNRKLEELARNAGEDVNTYVARAVASQMVADVRRTDPILLKALVDHLSESGVLQTDSMPDVEIVISDPDRLRALDDTGLLDSPREEAFDRITRAAADALDVKLAALTLIAADRHFFLSTVGMANMSEPADRSIPLNQSIDQYSVADGNPLVLEDARSDPVFMKHPVVRSGAVAAYLGIPLMSSDGHAIGTLCVYDDKPRQWGTGHIQILSDLAHLAADRIFGRTTA
ncbi:GAF domain-containing protein [Mycobacterium barrassiae]|nr:GAF domain-containing protein [Mycobacterium barrassiae]